jgi:hypothetical protein
MLFCLSLVYLSASFTLCYHLTPFDDAFHGLSSCPSPLLSMTAQEIKQELSSQKTEWNNAGIEPQYLDSVLVDFDLKTLVRLTTCRS